MSKKKGRRFRFVENNKITCDWCGHSIHALRNMEQKYYFCSHSHKIKYIIREIGRGIVSWLVRIYLKIKE